MTRTKIPTTLSEYQQHVRKEALKVQADMGWPDEKMNETLIALGLPPKITHMVPLKVTATATIIVPVDDCLTEEEAKASLTNLPAEKARERLASAGFTTGGFLVFATEPGEVPNMDTAQPGDSDMTLANSRIYQATPRDARQQCELYNADQGWYCTRPREHTGQHVAGNGTLIRAVWPQAEPVPVAEAF